MGWHTSILVNWSAINHSQSGSYSTYTGVSAIKSTLSYVYELVLKKWSYSLQDSLKLLDWDRQFIYKKLEAETDYDWSGMVFINLKGAK